MATVQEIVSDLMMNKGVELKDIIAAAQEVSAVPVSFDDALARYKTAQAGIMVNGVIDWDKLKAYLDWTPGEQLRPDIFRPYLVNMLATAVSEKRASLLLACMLLLLKTVK